MINYAGRHGVDPMDRFVSRVEVDPTTGCHNWTGDLDRDGYGRFWSNDEKRAHRWIMAHLGHNLTNMTVDHLCRNRRCVNPRHLEVVTREENSRRAKAAVTHCPEGHEYDNDNTYTRHNVRHCRRCHRAAQKRYSMRKRGESNDRVPY